MNKRGETTSRDGENRKRLQASLQRVLRKTKQSIHLTVSNVSFSRRMHNIQAGQNCYAHIVTTLDGDAPSPAARYPLSPRTHLTVGQTCKDCEAEKVSSSRRLFAFLRAHRDKSGVTERQPEELVSRRTPNWSEIPRNRKPYLVSDV